MDSDTASNGHEALAMVQAQVMAGQSVYKLILMDYELQNNLKGNEAAFMIRSYLSRVAPEQPYPYIVCLTNYSKMFIEKEQTDEYGFDEVVTKPSFKKSFSQLMKRAKIIQRSD